ncbi:tandem-95 repeat protein [Pseudoalteromonas luteoviolacea]|uniref:tandem-95 repeat protein n=1 Tax=Pseudoalteromonas luteoviolacea TaxID=43657 RepID=UPI001F3B65D2|nr:Ig-like domain-containing protein [Pseudoalteromonas luteoviolacea]MCF6439561.1 tandem-95 repeat protein [Pseudoalteromonas luteoviolacea]
MSISSKSINKKSKLSRHIQAALFGGVALNAGVASFGVSACMPGGDTSLCDYSGPVIELSTDNDGNNYLYLEGEGAVAILKEVSVSDKSTISKIVVTLDNPQEGISEGLSLTAASQNALNGVDNAEDIDLQHTIEISGAWASTQQVESLLKSIKYENKSFTPLEIDRKIKVKLYDSAYQSGEADAIFEIDDMLSVDSLVNIGTIQVEEGGKFAITSDLIQPKNGDMGIIDDLEITVASQTHRDFTQRDRFLNGSFIVDKNENDQVVKGYELIDDDYYAVKLTDADTHNVYFTHDGSEPIQGQAVYLALGLLTDKYQTVQMNSNRTIIRVPVEVLNVDDAPAFSVREPDITDTKLSLTPAMQDANELVIKQSPDGNIFAAYFVSGARSVYLEQFVDGHWKYLTSFSTADESVTQLTDETGLQMDFDDAASVHLAFNFDSSVQGEEKYTVKLVKYLPQTAQVAYEYANIENLNVKDGVFGFTLGSDGIPYVVTVDNTSYPMQYTKINKLELNQGVYILNEVLKTTEAVFANNTAQLLTSLSLVKVDSENFKYAATGESHSISHSNVHKVFKENGQFLSDRLLEMGLDKGSIGKHSAYTLEIASQENCSSDPLATHALIEDKSSNVFKYQYSYCQENGSRAFASKNLYNAVAASATLAGDAAYVTYIGALNDQGMSPVYVLKSEGDSFSPFYAFDVPFKVEAEPTLSVFDDGKLTIIVKDAQDGEAYSYIVGKPAPIDWSSTQISANRPSNILASIQIQDPDSDQLSFVLSTNDENVPGFFSLPGGIERDLVDELEMTDKGLSMKGSKEQINYLLTKFIFTPNADYQGTPQYTYTAQGLPDGEATSGTLDLNITSATDLESLFTSPPLNIIEGETSRITTDLFEYEAGNEGVVNDVRFTLDKDTLGPLVVYYDVDMNGELSEDEKLTEELISQAWSYEDIKSNRYYFVHDGSESLLDLSVTINMSLVEGSGFSESHRPTGTLKLPVKVELVDDAPVIGQKEQLSATEIPLSYDMELAADLVIDKSQDGTAFAAFFNAWEQKVYLQQFVDGDWQQRATFNTLPSSAYEGDMLLGSVTEGDKVADTSLQMLFDETGAMHLAFISKSSDTDTVSMSETVTLIKYAPERNEVVYNLADAETLKTHNEAFALALDAQGIPYVMAMTSKDIDESKRYVTFVKVNEQSGNYSLREIYSSDENLFYGISGKVNNSSIQKSKFSLAVANSTGLHFYAYGEGDDSTVHVLIGRLVEQNGVFSIGPTQFDRAEYYYPQGTNITGQVATLGSTEEQTGIHAFLAVGFETQFNDVKYASIFPSPIDINLEFEPLEPIMSKVLLNNETAYIVEVVDSSNGSKIKIKHVAEEQWQPYFEFEVPYQIDSAPELKFSDSNELLITLKNSRDIVSYLYSVGIKTAIDWSASEISANTPSNILAGLQIQDPDSEEAVFTLTTDDANLPGTFSLPTDFDKGAAIVEFTQNGKGIRLSGPIEDINRVLAALIFTPSSQYEGTPKYTYTVQGSSGDTETNGEFDLNIISYTDLESLFSLSTLNVIEGDKALLDPTLVQFTDPNAPVLDDLTFSFNAQSVHSGDIYLDANGDGKLSDSERLTEQQLATQRVINDIATKKFYFVHDGSESLIDFSILVDVSLREGSVHSQRYSSSATFTLPVKVELVDDKIEFGAQGSNITTSEIPLTDEMLNADQLLIKTSPSGEVHVIYTEGVQTATKLSWRKLIDGEWQNVADDQFLGKSSGEFQSISPQLQFSDDGSAYLVHIQHHSSDEKSLSMIHYDAKSGTSKTYPLSVGAGEGVQQGDLLASQTYALTLDENGTPYVMFHRDNLEWSNHVIYKFQQNGDELGWAEYRDIEGDLHYIYEPVNSIDTYYLPIQSLSLVIDAQSDVAYYAANMSGDKYYTDQALTQGEANSLQWNRAIVFKDNGVSLNTFNELGTSTWNVGQNMSDSITSIHVEQKKDALGNIVGLHSVVDTVSTGNENTRTVGYNYQPADGSDPIKLDPITLSRDTSNFVLGKETPYIVEVTPTDNGGSKVVIQHVVDGQWEVYQQYEVPFAVNKTPELEISGTNQLIVSVEGDNAGETHVAITKDEPTNWAVTPINATKPAQFFKDFALKDDDADEVTFSVNTNVDGLPGVFSLPEDFDPGTASIDFGDPDSAEYGKEVTITGTVEDVNRLIAALTFTPKDGYEGKPQYSYSLQSNTDDEPLTSNFDLNITDVNTAPTRVVNKPIYVLPEREGHTQITIERLKATDPDDNDAGIFYEIVELPESGLLRLTHSDGGSGLVETELQVGGSFSQLDLMDNEAGSKLEYIVENGIRAGAFKLQLIDGGEDGVQPSEPFIVSLVDTKPTVSLSQTDINLSALLYENAFTTIEALEFDEQSVTFELYEVIDGICKTDVFAGIYLDGNALKADDLFNAGALEICVVAKDDIWEVKQVFTLNLEDNLPVEAPSMPDLSSTWDKGVSDYDNITNSHFLQFTGSAEPNTRVTLISDIDGELGSIYVGADGKWVIATNAVETNGSHEITAVAKKGNITSLASVPLVLIFDNIVPPYSDGNFTQMSKGSQSLANTNHVSRVSKPTYIGVAQGFDFVSVYITAEDGSAKSFNEISVSENGSWTFTCPEELPDGSYTITFNGLDHAGNQTSLSSRVLYVDTDANDTPTIFNWLGEDGYINASELNTYQISGSSTHTFSSEDSLLATVQIGQKSIEQSGMFNNPTWSIGQFGINSAQFTNETEFKLTLQAADIHGNTSEPVVRIAKLDVVSPSVVIEAPQSLAGVNEPVRLLFSFSEPVASFTRDMISLQDNKGTLGPVVKHSSTSYSAIYTPAAGHTGQEEFKISAGHYFDIAGNQGQSASFKLDIDTTAPSMQSVNLSSGTYNIQNQAQASFSFVGAEVGATYRYTLISSGGGTISESGTIEQANQKVTFTDFASLKDGDLTLNVTLTDIAGNTSVASNAATLDTVSPEILSLTSNDMALKQGDEALITVTLSEAVEALSKSQFGVTNGKLSDFKALSSTTYQVKLTPSENVDGEVQLFITAGSIKDAAGNTNSEAKSLSISTDTSVPTGQSVTIDQAEINEDNDTALSFTLRGLEGSGLITYHISDGSNSIGSTSPIAITGTTQVISGIDVSSLAEGKLFLNVVVLDDAYNAAEAITASVIKAYNVAPTLTGTPASTINEDSEFVFEPLLNDPDTDNEHVFTINQTLPWATFDAQTGKLSGKPTDEHVGTYDNIQITVNDGRETFTLPAFSVEVVNTNDAPVAQNLAFDLNEAEQLIVAKAQGLIDTATDDDIDSGDVLKAIIVNEPQFGALVLNDDGSFTYSHDGSENHSDSFAYQIEDASGARSELRTVSLNMNAQADAPVAVDDFAQTLEDTQIIVKLLTNDSDAENDMVASSAAVVVEPKLGSYSIENGIVTYTPNLNATGQDSLTYTVKDLAGNTSTQATLIIDITPVNDKPVAKAFDLLVTEDTASDSIDLRSKSEDVEDTNPTGAIALTATPTKGFVTLDQQTGSLVYTPNADAIGSDSFSYTIADSDGLISEPANVTVNIGAVNDRPVVGNDTLAMTEDEVATLNILANDSDVEDQGFNAANVMLEDKGTGAGVYDMADVAVLADGTLELTPKQDANGRFSFTYTLVDSEQLSSESATVTVDITPVNDAPVALNNTAELFEEGSHEVNVLGNDSDVDKGDTLDLSSVSVVKQPLNGQVSVTGTGAIVYVPNTNFNGDDAFTYTVRDAAGALSNEATVTMTVKPLNDAPVAQSQSVSLAEDGSLLITLAATDIDGDELSYQIVSSTVSGSLTQQSVNTWTYAPNANFNGQDSLQFIAFDGQVESEPAQVTIAVDAANDVPEISGAPATSVDQDVAYSFTPQATDLDEDSLTFRVSNLPVWASFDVQSGTLSGTPGRDDVGSYRDIVITVSDGELTASLSPFAIEVGYVNAKPIAQGMDVFVNEDSSVSFSAPVSDADQDSLSISITEQPSFGSLTVQGQLFTYIPGVNFNGSDGFSYVVNDGAEDSVAAQVAISVNPLNDAPVAQNDAFTFNTVSSSYTLDVLTNDTDVDAGDVLSLVGASASIGSVTIENGQLVYQPQATVQDTAVITYMIADPQGEQSSATATVDIVNNAAGSVGQLTLTTPQDKAVDATGLFTKVDLGSATATDGNGNPIAVSLVDGITVFAPGLHHVYWKATDSNAQSIVKKQTLTVNPLISLSKDSQIAEEHTHTVKVFLNGEAPSYPVTVPYTISGTADGNDHDLIDGEVIINEGNEGVIRFNVFGDGVVEGNETIVITLADTLNRGAKFASTVTIVEENVAPALAFETVQSGESRSLVVQSGGLVQVKASATDANPLDTVTFSWVAEDQQLGNLSTAADVFELDPKGLNAGIYKLSVTASDDGVPSLSSTVDVYLEVVESLPELGIEDSDGDLIPDSQEGFADTDNDGIPDYLDANSDCNVIPGQIKDPNQFLVEGEPGVCLRKGVTVAQNSTGGAQLLESELPADAEATNIGGLFDFIATGLPKEGDVYGIVIPQRKPIPVNAIYRKYRNGEWINFAVTDQDKILSAAGEPGYCPPPGSSEWRDGLNEGDWCVQLKIVDGGPNDDDGIANRSIVDPGGIAVLASDNTLPLAQADSLTIGVSESVFIDVLSNDTDADGDVLTITGVSVDFGEVEVIDNQLKYTPPMNFVGTASITYSIADGKGGTASSTVTVELVVNNAPVTTPDSANTTDKSSLIIDVLSNDTDPDGDVLTLVSAQANQGKATVNSDGTLSYEPQLGFTGEDVVTYVVKDSKGATSEGIVKVSVTAHQSVSAQNTSSGSLGGLLVVMISALVIRRRSSKLPAYALITTACVMSSSAAAQQWRVQGTLGQAEVSADFSALPTSTQITNIDNSSQSLSVGAFFQLMPSWNIGMRYIDLGQGRVNFSDSTVNPDSWQKTVSRVAPVLPEGFALQTGLEVFKHNKLHAELFLGAYGWDYSIESKTNTRSYTEYKQKGTSAYIGSAIGYELTDNVSAVLTYSYYRLSANRISEVAAGVEVRF